MKIIVDTNVWYELAKNETLFEKVKDLSLVPSFVNIYELSRTTNIIKQEDLVRNAIRKLFHFQKNLIIEPSLIHIAKLNHQFDYPLQSETIKHLDKLSLLAKGCSFETGNFTEDLLGKVTDDANVILKQIKENIADKKTHRKKSSISTTEKFISHCVKEVTNNEHNLKNFDFSKVELLVNTLDVFLKELEVSKRKIDKNDWSDIFIMGYVQPNEKYWTLENKWHGFITSAKCQHYLFNPDAL